MRLALGKKEFMCLVVLENKNKGGSKRTWQTINELTSRKSGKTTVTSLKVNRLSVTNHSELSDKFNPRRHKGGGRSI